jgi:hypothetical protein
MKNNSTGSHPSFFVDEETTGLDQKEKKMLRCHKKNKMVVSARKLFYAALTAALLMNVIANAQQINVDNTVINLGSGSYIVAGDITLQNSGSIDNSGTLLMSGSWINNAGGLINGSPGLAEFNGSSGQSIAGTAATNFYNLTVNNSSGLSLSNNASISNGLAFSTGKISTGGYTLSLGSSSTVTGAAAGKYIYGNLQISFAASGNRNFDIGDAVTYAPVSLNISGVTSSGSVTAVTLSGAEPNENNPLVNASGINQSAKANRYWTLTSSGIVFSNCSAIFNYDAGEATGNSLNYVLRKFNGPSTWSTTAAGIVTATSTQATGLTSFGAFEAGEANAAPVIGSCPGDITQCTNTVTWTNPSSSGSPVADIICNPASGSTFATGTTMVTCTATNINGTSSCSFNVTVNMPSVAATGATNNALYGQICFGGNVTLTVTGGTLGTGASWIWYDGGCGSGASVGTGSSITVTPSTPGLHQYYVRAESSCGPTSCQSVSVNVITAPPSGVVSYTSTLADGCVGSPAATVLVNAVTGAAFYHWTSAQAGVRFNGNPSPYETTVPTVNLTFVSLPASGSSGWSVCVFGGNACGNSNTICSWVRAIVGKPTAINGAVTGCPGTNGNAYSSAFEPGSAFYIWNSTGGIVINGNGAQNITVDFPGGFVSGTLSVHAQTSCGYNSADRTITISRAPSIPGSITGPNYPCPNASSSFSVTAVPGAVNYSWTTSVPGAIVTGTTTSCSIQFPSTIPAGSTVSVAANSSCPYSSAVRSKGIASGVPGVPVVISGPSSGQCGQTGVSYTVSPVALATSYNWSTTCGSISGPSNLSGVTIDWPGNFAGCVLSVSAINSCGTGIPRTLNVYGAPGIPAAISGNASPCAGAIEVYSTPGSSGATSYIWTTPAGSSIIGPANGASILLQWDNAGGNITVRGANTCGNSGVRTMPCTISCRMNQLSASAMMHAEIFPNPAIEKAVLKFYAASDEKFSMRMEDAAGRIVFRNDADAVAGINIVDLDFSALAKGVYLFTFSGESNEQLRVIIQ